MAVVNDGTFNGMECFYPVESEGSGFIFDLQMTMAFSVATNYVFSGEMLTQVLHELLSQMAEQSGASRASARPVPDAN